MDYLGLIIGMFLLVVVFGALLGMTYFLAKTRVDEAEEREKKAFAVPIKPKTADSEDEVR